MENLTAHEDFLKNLTEVNTLGEKLTVIHKAVRHYYQFIDRIAVAIHDEKTGKLKTFLSSNLQSNPLTYYEIALDDAPSLKQIAESGTARVVNDLEIFRDGKNIHTQKINDSGFLSSYTLPYLSDGQLIGFIFFNSFQKDIFTEKILRLLDVFAHLTMANLQSELNSIRTMISSLRTATKMVHYKDPETGFHLERMSRFSRLIALELAKTNKYDFDDEFIEHIFIFAPLHDIGKISIPDEVLLKPGKLSDDEFKIMKTHTTKGREIVDVIIENFGFESFKHIKVLRHIAEYHHETRDGKGYPRGLSQDKIPIEARIIAIADIFDALTSERPYKKPWENDKAFEYMQQLKLNKLDRDCVDALIANREQVEQIQDTFSEP